MITGETFYGYADCESEVVETVGPNDKKIKVPDRAISRTRRGDLHRPFHRNGYFLQALQAIRRALDKVEEVA